MRLPVPLISFLSITLWLTAGSARAAGDLEEAFSELRRQATQSAYDLRIAEASAGQARAAHYTSVARWLPRLDLQLSQSRSKDFSILTSGSLGALGSAFAFTPQALSLMRWELDLSVPLYRRSIHLGLAQAAAEKELTLARLELQRAELDWRLRSLFGAYLLSRYKEATLRNTIEIAKTSLREAQLRFELGQRTKVDVLKAKANLATLESRRIAYAQERATALRDFLEYSGLENQVLESVGLEKLLESEEEVLSGIDRFTAPEKALASVEPFLPGAAQGEMPEEELQRHIVESSQRYRASLAEEESGYARARGAMSQEWPELSFRGSLNKQARDWTTAFSGSDRSYSLALVLSIPLFSGGSLVSTYYEKSNAQRAGELKARKDILSLRKEIETDRLRIRSLQAMLEAQKLSRAQNEEIVRLSFKSYQLGKATILELLTSQDELIEAKVNLAKTKIDLSVALRKLAWSLGVAIQ
ncbi:MAG: TolC family protein [Oligoflexia bacterium]|nr:TolC family protein [Oligoflexia bacterium]